MGTTRDVHAMRPFRRRFRRSAVGLGPIDQHLRPSQLENTTQYGWRGVSRETARELVREALARESASSPVERPVG
jgi:hypothetical protein